MKRSRLERPASPAAAAAATRPNKGVWLAAAVLVLSALAAYRNSFDGPFIFDDDLCITDNPSIRHLWPITTALCPPAGSATVSERPVLNLSLAINYALGGVDVRGYHDSASLIVSPYFSVGPFGVVVRVS